MFHLNNNTPFAAQSFKMSNHSGVDIFCVVVKATYELEPELRIARKQHPITMVDTYWGEPGQSSLKYPSEVHPQKPGTDVIVVAQACAPDEHPVTQLDAGLSIAGRIRIIRVFGDRFWRKGFLSTEPGPPKPFLRLPVVYERAYGGIRTVVDTPDILVEARNPVGKGFWGNRSPKSLEKEALPNIEDPKNLIKSPLDQPPPTGFGAIAPHWQPRASYAGTYDERWQKIRAPFLPEDFNIRFYHTAHPGLIFEKYLQGGEPVVMMNLSLRGRQQFALPKDEPKVEINITGRLEAMKANLETVLLEPTDERISLLWRAQASNGKTITRAKAEITL